MDQETLDKFRAVVAKQRKAILESEDPKQAAIDHLTEMGFLNPDGTLAERFGGPPVKPEREPVSEKAN